MTPEQIEQWACESGFKQGPQPCETPLLAMLKNSEFRRLTRFAELVAQHAAQQEREWCAQVCEAVASPYQAAGASVALECAAAIRNSAQG